MTMDRPPRSYSFCKRKGQARGGTGIRYTNALDVWSYV